MEKEDQKLRQLLKKVRLVESRSLRVEESFKENLREKLYKAYLTKQKKRNFLHSLFDSVSFRLRLAFYSLGILFIIIGIGIGAYILSNQNNDQSYPHLANDEQEILLAANIAFLEGDVEYKDASSDKWIAATSGDTLEQGDSIQTGKNSRAVILIDNGNAVRLDSESEILLVSMNPQSVLIEQLRGESYSRISTSKEHTHTVEAQNVEAQSLGTAYTVRSNLKEKKVSVFVYESKVKLKIGDKEASVKELKKAVVEVKKDKLTVKNMVQKDYQNSFASWNMNQDKKMGYKTHETIGPKVTVLSPTTAMSTYSSEIDISGIVTDESPLKKIVVNGAIYTQKDEFGKGFNPKDGTFAVTVPLEIGGNMINIQAYDIYWNASEVSTVTVNRLYPKIVNPPPSSEIAVSAQVLGNLKVKVTITITTDALKGFKIAWSQTNTTPKYPSDEWTYTGGSYGPGTYSFEVSIEKAGTYYFGASIWEGSGSQAGSVYGSTGPIIIH